MSGWCVITDTPVDRCDRGAGGHGGPGTVSPTVSLLSYTLRYINLEGVDVICQVGV